jgi:hypothetical protein
MMRERGGGDDYDSSDSVSLFASFVCLKLTPLGFIRLERDGQR